MTANQTTKTWAFGELFNAVLATRTQSYDSTEEPRRLIISRPAAADNREWHR